MEIIQEQTKAEHVKYKREAISLREELESENVQLKEKVTFLRQN